MTETLVDLREVGRVFDGIAAIEQVTLTIQRGDRIALIGRSGSGKSTLLNLIAGLDTPTSGRITWPALASDTPLLPGQIGLMFQARSLIPWLDVDENVQLPLQIAGDAREAGTRSIVLLSLFGLEALAEKLPEELSGGQAQRVSLARAMITAPALLLADEPTGQLDHAAAADVIDRLATWANQRDVALVVATHDPIVARTMTKTWTIDRGQVVEVPP